jgi:hypothetical protein
MIKLQTTQLKRTPVHQVVESLRSSPGFNDFVFIVRSELETARDEYESQPANEYTRGKLQGFRRILELLSTGL